MFTLKSNSDFRKTRDFLKRLVTGQYFSDLDSYGRRGVEALSAATPQDTGLTAHSWNYRILTTPNGKRIEWYNTNEVAGTPVAILIQYGHGTGTGGYVQGRDFINPAMRPVFDQIILDISKKVKS